MTANLELDARVWPLSADALVAAACARSTCNLGPERWRRAVGDIPFTLVCEGLPTCPEP